MLRYRTLIKTILPLVRPISQTSTLHSFPLFLRNRPHFSFCAAPDNDREELIFFLNTKLKSSPNLQDFKDSLHALRSLHAKGYLTKEQARHLYAQCVSYFGSVSNDMSTFSETDLIAVSDEMTGASQSLIEALEPAMVTSSLRIWSQFDPRFAKPYLHFIEFLLTRSKFMNLFEGEQILQLLDSYYQIREKYETDKFAYIYDKCDEYICSNKALSFSPDNLARVLYLYSKCDLGCDTLFQALHERFVMQKDNMSVENIIICAWSFVNYNLRKKNKNLKIYDHETYQKILSNIDKLNSYRLKQFLWAYHKEQELFG